MNQSSQHGNSGAGKKALTLIVFLALIILAVMVAGAVIGPGAFNWIFT